MPASLILDTSAVVAILSREPDSGRLLEILFAAKNRLLPSPCAAEALIVLRTKLGQNPEPLLSDFYCEFAIQLIAFEPQHLPWFNYAYTTFGKGRHPAALNFGDCFTYSIAKSTGLPLLFTGNDFRQTDLTLC
jgi:ribonuclease VapC